MRRSTSWVVGVLGVFIFVLIVGSIYEQSSRENVAARYPPRGKLIDIGARHIQIDCRGAGLPVVVFEAGRDLAGSLSWDLVHDHVARFTRACAYSRAGILWSEPKKPPNTVKGAAADLHAALVQAGELGPYVLTGHSAGGLAILVYTKLYPDEVSGLVFVDSSHPQQFERMNATLDWDPPQLSIGTRLARAFAWAGVVRLQSPSPLPDNDDAMNIITAYGPVSFISAAQEIEQDHEWFGEAGTVTSLGSRPTFVLSGMKPVPEITRLTPEMEQKRLGIWLEMQKELAMLSTVNRHDEDAEATHYVQASSPSHVVTAVQWVVDKVRGQNVEAKAE